MDAVAREMVRDVLRCEEYKCCDRWGEGLGVNSGSCCFSDPSCCFFEVKTRKYSPSSHLLHSVSTFITPFCWIWCQTIHSLSLSLWSGTFSSAKTQAGNKSEVEWGEMSLTCPLACHHDQYKHISQNGPCVFLCISPTACLLGATVFYARSKCWIISGGRKWVQFKQRCSQVSNLEALSALSPQ